MKWFLLFSLLLNIILGSLLVARKPQPAEPIVIEKIKPKIIEKKIFLSEDKSAVTSNKKNTETDEVIPPQPSLPEDSEVREQLEKVKEERENLYHALGISPREIQAIEDVKRLYQEKYADLIPEDDMGIETLEQRRRFLELDERREEALERIVGKKKWREFRQRQRDYNRRLYKETTDKVFVPLEI